VRIGIYRRKPVTGLCNESAIRLCAVDLSEGIEGAVKSKIGLRTYRELGRGPQEGFISPARCSRKELPSREFFATMGAKLLSRLNRSPQGHTARNSGCTYQ